MQQEEPSPDITLGNPGLICPIPYSEPLPLLLSVCLSDNHVMLPGDGWARQTMQAMSIQKLLL
jgi:hypothetical protein